MELKKRREPKEKSMKRKIKKGRWDKWKEKWKKENYREVIMSYSD